MELKIESQVRGTRIITGPETRERRSLLNQLIAIAESAGFEEVTLPSIEPADIYTTKAGSEILDQMYVFSDKKNRRLCLRPEVTATVQLIADKHFKRERNKKLWYFTRCWRYEKPQQGRYREFYQFGLEIINPTDEKLRDRLIDIAASMVALKTTQYEISDSVTRGLHYYIGNGFEISVPMLGAQKQVVGGGPYAQGIGFAIGFDRLMLCQ